MTTIKQWNLQAACFCMALLIVLSTLFTPQTLSALDSLPFYGFDASNFTKNLPMIIKPSNTAGRRNEIQGIDVSQYQGTIDWKKVANDNIEFAFVRASYGKEMDKKFKVNAQGAYKNGIPVGAYHYATFSNVTEAKAQAKYFIQLLKSVNITYPVVLDLEGNRTTQKVSKAKLTTAGLAFMDAVKQAGYKVMLYSNENFFLSHIDANAVQKKGYELWVANYNNRPAKVSHKIWQHTSKGQVDGIQTSVDMNVAYQNFSAARTVTVNKTDSDLVKTWFNTNYNTDIAIDTLNMTELKNAYIVAIQTELNNQSNAKLQVNGRMSSDTAKYFSSISFQNGEQNALAYVIEAALFYKGYYSGTPTGVWDSKAISALKAYQNAQSLSGNGKLNAETLRQLFK